MEDSPSFPRSTITIQGDVTVAGVAHWTGQAISVAVKDMQDILRMP